MSEKSAPATAREKPASSLRLVHSFQGAFFSYKIIEHLMDGGTVERANAHMRLRNAANTAGVDRYLLQDALYEVSMELQNTEDFEHVSMARSWDDATVESEFLYAPRDSDFRKLKNTRHIIQHQIRKTDLKGHIHINIDREERVLVVEADTPESFFRFKAFMLEMGLYEPRERSPLKPEDRILSVD